MKRSTKSILGVAVLAAAIGSILFSQSLAPAIANQLPVATKVQEERPLAKQEGAAAAAGNSLLHNIPRAGDFLMGDKNAKLSIVEYASLTCGHCAHFHTGVLPVLKEKYIATGKVNYVLRLFPLNEPAMKASVLARCVGNKEGAMRYHLLTKSLFEQQDKWAFDPNYLPLLKTIATGVGVDAAQVDQCLSDKEVEMAILSDQQAASVELKVRSTPTVFVGDALSTANTPEALSAQIDEALK